jgi:hypothetical protein
MLREMEGMVSTLNLELHKCKQEHKKEMLKMKDELSNQDKMYKDKLQ